MAVDSRIGEGSRFYFMLPLEPAKENIMHESAQLKKVLRLAKGFSVRALVVDDSKINRDVMSKLLKGIGVKVVEAEDGIDALEKLRENQPDIIFMDHVMPRMNGVECIKQINKEFKKKIKTIMVSASAFDHERKIFEKAGCDKMLSKPFKAESAFDCMAKLLDIELEYEGEKQADAGTPGKAIPDISKINVPEELLTDITKAAELYEITEIEKALSELEKIGPETSGLAKHLREFANNYDMEGLLNALKKK